ncbi:MAG: helix-turn-helix transcriptional regulator [Bacteroidales bacterium]|nr:helix-turn-helix transcriptional regulator [Bacteroidales bacterium]
MNKPIFDLIKLDKASKKIKSVTHPLRIAIIKMLIDDDKLNVTEIYTRLKIEQAAASHHLSLLRNSGVLKTSREGKEIFYSLNIPNLSKIIDCINLCAEI